MGRMKLYSPNKFKFKWSLDRPSSPRHYIACTDLNSKERQNYSYCMHTFIIHVHIYNLITIKRNRIIPLELKLFQIVTQMTP